MAENNSRNGRIGVTTENIFPVIKKFLYSDHEIFLRELVANAVDATQKMKEYLVVRIKELFDNREDILGGYSDFAFVFHICAVNCFTSKKRTCLPARPRYHQLVFHWQMTAILSSTICKGIS